MAPNDSSSSSADNSKPASANFVPNCTLLLSSPKFAPYPRASPSKKPNFDHLHTAIVSASDKCLRFLHSFASQNPINKFFSFTHEFQSFFNQIHFRSYRKANSLSTHNFAAVTGDSVAGIVVANGILNFLNVYNTVLIVRLVLTWFPNAPSAIVSPLSTICDPYLNIFRGIIPPLGGTLDLSPILAFLVLNVFTSTAAALPAELPVMESNQQSSSSPARFSDLTSSQMKWVRRLHGSEIRTKSSGNAH